MRHTTLSVLAAVALAMGCSGGDGDLGDSCSQHGDCQSRYQCVQNVCVNRCQRSPECGDGYRCDDDHLCQLAEGKVGDSCTSEIDCGPGLSCQFDSMLDSNGQLRASCTATQEGRPAGSTCFGDEECRNGTCDLGRCVDLCTSEERGSRDCAVGNSCMTVPRVDAYGAPYEGCLPSGGNITWTIPVVSPQPSFLFPIPSEASFASLVFDVDDPQQKVGALAVTSPSGAQLITKCEDDPSCRTSPDDPETVLRHQYAQPVRHMPELGQSVLAMPSNPDIPLETGVYYVIAATKRPGPMGGLGSIPKVTAVVRIGSGGSLDLHLHFLDLQDHPCAAAFKDLTLNAATAANEEFFRGGFLVKLGAILSSSANITIASVTYDDILDHPDLDTLDVTRAGQLLKLGTNPRGINVFFVRSLSPAGIQAFGPGPGPAGLGGTKRSGIVIGIDSLCYRSWDDLARLTAHEIARYMGLYHNVEVNSQRTDPIDDSNEQPDNLMFYSGLGGGEFLSDKQKRILVRSPVLR
jgi:hypothetical protein